MSPECESAAGLTDDLGRISEIAVDVTGHQILQGRSAAPVGQHLSSSSRRLQSANIVEQIKRFIFSRKWPDFADSHASIPASSNILPHLPTGKLRPLAITTAERSPLAADIPTMQEAGQLAFPGRGFIFSLSDEVAMAFIESRLAAAAIVAAMLIAALSPLWMH